MKTLSIALLLFTNISFALGTTHILKYPLLPTTNKTNCDNYISNNSSSFNKKLEAMLDEHMNKNWQKADELLSSIVTSSNSELSLTKNTYQEALLNCSTYYKFTDGKEYFFELRTKIQLFAMTLQVYNSKKKICPNLVQQNLSDINSLTNIINSSKRK